MKRNFLLVALFLSGFCVNAQSTEEKEVSQVVETLRKAMIDADESVLKSITSDILSYGHSSGHIDTKKEFINNLLSGKSDFITIDLTGQSIHFSGDVAIVRHILSAKLNDNGKPGEINLRVLLVWQKQSGKWILVARQAVRVI